MLRGGAWRGFGGVWWTVDGGWSDETEGMPIVSLQAIENKGANLDKIATLGLGISEKRKAHNGAGLRASVTELHGVSS